MSEAITGVLKFAFGLISNKLRTYGAEKLQDGGLTDQKFRGFIVRELDDIKSKLDAMSRKDLCTSISCLQQGINRLIMSFGESSESGNPSSSELSCTGASSIETKPVQQSVTVKDAVVLASAIGKLKIESNERFDLAKESFKEAGKKASEAFHNAALSTEERILASKVRIASGILQHLDDLELAVSDCLHYLQELNDMPAIQEIFSVHVKGGVKSVFKKQSRTEIVETVTMINWVLADFISKFTTRRMAVFDWPMIRCGKRVIHPIYFKNERLPNLEEMKITPPWDMVVLETNVGKSALNKKGDLVCFTKDRRGPQKLDKATGKLQPYRLSCSDESTEHPQPDSKISDLAFDEDDTLYVLSGNEEVGFTLSVYSADGGNTHHCTLEFLNGQEYFEIYINVNNDKNVVIGRYDEGTIMVYLCNSNGKLINSFDTGLKSDYFLKFVSGFCNNEVVLLTKKYADILRDSNVLHIYTEDGQLQKTVKFHPSEGRDTNDSLFYNQVTKNIIGNVTDLDDDKILIEYLSGQTAELQHSYLLYETNFPESILFSDLVCHTNGAVTLITHSYPPHVISLQKPSQ